MKRTLMARRSEIGNPLLGTWKLTAYVVTTAAGERTTPFGENPTGIPQLLR